MFWPMISTLLLSKLTNPYRNHPNAPNKPRSKGLIFSLKKIGGSFKNFYVIAHPVSHDSWFARRFPLEHDRAGVLSAGVELLDHVRTRCGRDNRLHAQHAHSHIPGPLKPTTQRAHTAETEAKFVCQRERE